MADQRAESPMNASTLPERPDAADEYIFSSGGAMNPDHPLLARAQAALKTQLQGNQQRLQEELREKNIMLDVRVA